MSVNENSGIIIVDSKAVLQIAASLTDNPRSIIYNGNMFVEQATGNNKAKQWRVNLEVFNQDVCDIIDN